MNNLRADSIHQAPHEAEDDDRGDAALGRRAPTGFTQALAARGVLREIARG